MKLFISSIILLTSLSSLAIGQESQRLQIKRGPINNFLSDSTVLLSEGKEKLDSVFTVVMPSTGQTLYWSAKACRLIGVKNGKSTTLTELEATGAHPLNQINWSNWSPEILRHSNCRWFTRISLHHGSTQCGRKISIFIRW